MKTLAALFALVAALIFAPSLATPAKAQPCQWNYTAPGNVSTATYCGNEHVQGNSQIDGNLNVNGTITGTLPNISTLGFASVAAMEAYASPSNLQVAVVTGLQGGYFQIINQACNNGGTGDGGIQFPSTNASMCWVRQLPPGTYGYSPRWFGASCLGINPDNAVSGTSGTSTINDSNNPWGAVQSGWIAVVNGGAASGLQLVTTVSHVNTPGNITLATNLGANISNATVYIYPDDTAGVTKTVAAANAANAAMQVPSGQNCALANPGTFNVFTLTGPGLDLNGGQFWMGQTGAVTQTGNVFAFNCNNCGVWNGTINGLYQTNQNIAQGYSGTLVFNSGSALPGYTGSFLRDLVIENTKARGFAIQDNSNTVISNVTTKNCGDLTYSAGYAGMAFCGQVENPQASLNITNFTADGCSQSCLIVDDLSLATLDPNYRGTITNFNARSAGYYALDLETLLGCTSVAQVQVDNSSITPSGNIVGGGIIARDIRCHNQNQIVINAPSNADIVEDSGGDTPAGNQFVQLNNLKLVNATHNGLLDVVSNVGFSTTRFTIAHVNTDVFQIGLNTAIPCSTTNPFVQYMMFDDVHVSHLYTGSIDFTLSQQGNPSTMYYVQGKDSDLGRTLYTSLGSNPDATDLDYFRVFEQTTTYAGGITRIGRASTSWTNPFSTFTCPT